MNYCHQSDAKAGVLKPDETCFITLFLNSILDFFGLFLRLHCGERLTDVIKQIYLKQRVAITNMKFKSIYLYLWALLIKYLKLYEFTIPISSVMCVWYTEPEGEICIIS